MKNFSQAGLKRNTSYGYPASVDNGSVDSVDSSLMSAKTLG